MFMAFGTVTVVKIPRDAATRVSLGYAYVDFLDVASGAWGGGGGGWGGESAPSLPAPRAPSSTALGAVTFSA